MSGWPRERWERPGAAVQVQREEFLMFVLQHLGIVDGDDMDRILAIFSSLDTSGDGVLDMQDVKHHLSGGLSGALSARLSTRLSGHSGDVGSAADAVSNAS